MTSELSSHLDWVKLGTLRLRSRRVADGALVGGHASLRRGAGLEFAGHRNYVPGDDLRWLDHRAVLRQDRLVIKQFETETERAVRLVVDATQSMGFRSEQAPLSKLEFASLLAAAITRVAVRTGDPVALDFLGGKGARSLPPAGGLQAFERSVELLERVSASGTLGTTAAALEAALGTTLRRAPRGSVIVLFSDLLDLAESAPDVLASLATNGRQTVVVQVLDPLEALFKLEGPVRLRSSEGDLTVETNAGAVRASYLDALKALQQRFREALWAQKSELVICRTDQDPVATLRAILHAAEGRRP
jgi:uncharacterized protein (DUF58 family)